MSPITNSTTAPPSHASACLHCADSAAGPGSWGNPALFIFEPHRLPRPPSLAQGTVDGTETASLVPRKAKKKSISDCLPREAVLVSVTEDMKMSKPSDLVQGTLDMLLLKILALEPMNGFAVSQRLTQVSGDVLQVSDGSLYPALHKLEQEGWITAEWKTSEYGRRAKYYSLTRLGRRQLEREAGNWGRISSAISRVIKLKEA
jgi:PadR family transcriptional regulator PadR